MPCGSWSTRGWPTVGRDQLIEYFGQHIESSTWDLVRHVVNGWASGTRAASGAEVGTPPPGRRRSRSPGRHTNTGVAIHNLDHATSMRDMKDRGDTRTPIYRAGTLPPPSATALYHELTITNAGRDRPTRQGVCHARHRTTVRPAWRSTRRRSGGGTPPAPEGQRAEARRSGGRHVGRGGPRQGGHDEHLAMSHSPAVGPTAHLTDRVYGASSDRTCVEHTRSVSEDRHHTGLHAVRVT